MYVFIHISICNYNNQREKCYEVERELGKCERGQREQTWGGLERGKEDVIIIFN